MIQKTHRIPTIFAILILLFGIGGGIFFAESSLQLVSRAGSEGKPHEIRVTNRTSSMATISWITDKKTLGVVRYNIYGSRQEKIAIDSRILSGRIGLFITHYVTLRNLKAQKKYAFIIQSDNKTYDNNGKPYIFTTFSHAKLNNLDPAYGEIFLPNNKPAVGSIVYLNLEGAEPLSALVRKSGSWLIPLNIAYESNSGLPVKNIASRKIELFIRSSTGDVAQAVTNTEYDSPMPTIIIGKRYDFRLKAKITQVEPAVLGKLDIEREKASFSIIQPENQQAISSSRPLIRGKGFPGQKVSIIIESSPQRAVVTVDSRGNWSWTPPKNLSSGFHTVKVIITDKMGKQVILRRNFRILESGSSVLGEATPSATLAPTPIEPTSTPTLTPTEPVLSLTPTPVFTLPTPTETIPPNLRTGNPIPTIVFIVIGSLLVLFGLKPAIIVKTLKHENNLF